MKILCGTDFSSHAAQAGDAAAAIAGRTSSELLLVHAFDALALAFPGNVRERLLASAREQLGKEADRLRKLGVRVEEEVVEGAPDEVIVDLAKRAGAELVVVSHFGRRAPARWLIGSVAERVSESSPVPTLVVRSADAFKPWARGERPLVALAGVDFTASSDAALRWLSQLQHLAPCDITALYLNWLPAEGARFGFGGPYSLTANPPEIRLLLERDLRERVDRLLGENNVRILVRSGWGRVDAALCEAGRELTADLIVVGAHQRHGIRGLWHVSVSRGVLHSAATSVVCVPMMPVETKAAQPVPEIQRVLAATDLSGLGDRAVAYAFSALKDGGVVRLIHVIDPLRLPNPLIGGQFEEHPTNEAYAARVEECVQGLRRLIPPDVDKGGIETEVEVIEDGDAPNAICRAAERFGADLICLGSHGRSGISEAILGSVAHGVMKHSCKPLLVIRPQEK